MPNISNQESLRPGVLADFKEIWKQKFPVLKKTQERLIKFLSASTVRNAIYALKDAVPMVKLWPYGAPRSHQAFRDRLISIGKNNYELTINWSGFDEDDDQLGDLKQHVDMAANRFLQLPDALLAEYLNGAAVENGSLLLAYDGVGLFNTVDGDGAARYGVTNGNIVSSSGLTIPAIINDLASVQARFLRFKDPAGQPMFHPEEVSYKNMFVVAPTNMNLLFQKASEAELIRSDLASSMPESNWIKGTFQYEINNRITTTTDWYVFLQHPYYKAFAYRAPGDVRTLMQTIDNSDRGREYNEKGIFADIRTRLGLFFPGVAIKVSAS